jgi:formylglycine-generating enzyme
MKSKSIIIIVSLFAIIVVAFFIIKSRNEPQLLAPEGMAYVKGNEKIKPYFIDKTPVTVEQFRKFIEATHYKTESEKFGDSGVFDFKTGEWSLVKGANWQYPQGQLNAKAPGNHPVTQVSWNDAVAYCKWAKKRLPIKTEYDFAANNAEEEFKTYAWGENAIENGKYKANFWQGSFPQYNSNDDGFLTTSPVGYFGVNKLGLSDMGGNVWEWVQEWDSEKPTEKIQCGGSYLCDPNVCHGFKIGNTSTTSPETGLMHVGFRCVRDGK